MNRWKWKHTSLLLHLKLRFCEDHRRWVEVTFLRFLMLWSHILQKDNWKEKGLNIKAGCFVTRFFYTYGQYLGQGLTNVEKPIKATESYRNCFKQLWAQKCKKKSQNEITALLIQYQCLSFVPMQEIPVFDAIKHSLNPLNTALKRRTKKFLLK